MKYSASMAVFVYIQFWTILIFGGYVASFQTTTPVPTPPVISFYPPELEPLAINDKQTVYFNCSEFLQQNIKQYNTSLTLAVSPVNTKLVDISRSLDNGVTHGHELPLKINFGGPASREENFWGSFVVAGKSLGYTYLSITITNLSSIANSNVSQPKNSFLYPLTVIRPKRQVDLAFDCVMAIVALLNSFGMGCVTRFTKLKDHIKHPVAVLIGFCCQFIIMPVLAFGLAKIFQMNNEMGLGLFYTACIPGGGFGYLIVMTIMDGDRTLCLAMNCLSTLVVLVTAPLWMLALGQFFPRPAQSTDPLLNMELWLAALLVPYASGLLLKQFKECAAEAILNWLIKPMLLLVTILMVTLGVYINDYMFDEIPVLSMLASAFLPLFGFLIGGGIAFASRQQKDNMKTIATETAISNCLIVMVSLRFSLDQPSADMASTVPFWVLIFTPATSVCLFLGRKMKHCMWNYCEKKIKKQQEAAEEFSLRKGFESMSNNTAYAAAAVSSGGTRGSQDKERPRNSIVSNDRSKSPLLDQQITVL